MGRKRSNGESCKTCGNRYTCPTKTGKPLEARRGRAVRWVGATEAGRQAKDRGWCDAWEPCYDEEWT